MILFERAVSRFHVIALGASGEAEHYTKRVGYFTSAYLEIYSVLLCEVLNPLHFVLVVKLAQNLFLNSLIPHGSELPLLTYTKFPCVSRILYIYALLSLKPL